MSIPNDRLNRMLGLCSTCGADPCKCPSANAAIKSPSLSSMTLTSHAHSGGFISGASVLKTTTVDDLVARGHRRIDVTEPDPEPKSSFVPSWEKDEPEEEEEMFNTSTFAKIVPVKDPELTEAIRTLRKALADEVHEAIMDGNATLASDLMSMTTTELLDHLT